jgi:hypothetical protein
MVWETLTCTVVGTVMLRLPPLMSCRVTAVPTTPVTMPRAKAGGVPLGLGRGLRSGLGEKEGRAPPLPPPNGPALQEPLTLGLSSTVVALMAPLASLLPVAVMQEPLVMSATVPVRVLLTGVAGVTATVTSPVVVLRISLVPLIWTSSPAAAPPRRAALAPPLGDGDCAPVLVAAVELLQAASARVAKAPVRASPVLVMVGPLVALVTARAAPRWGRVERRAPPGRRRRSGQLRPQRRRRRAPAWA